jgi:hypothetical protein
VLGFLSFLTSGVDGEAERVAINPGEGEGDSLSAAGDVETGGQCGLGDDFERGESLRLGLFGLSGPSLTSGHRSRTLSFLSGGPLLLDRRPGGSGALARSVR